MLLRLFSESIREYETSEQMLLSSGYKGIRPSGMCRHLSLPSFQSFFLVLIRTSLWGHLCPTSWSHDLQRICHKWDLLVHVRGWIWNTRFWKENLPQFFKVGRTANVLQRYQQWQLNSQQILKLLSFPSPFSSHVSFYDSFSEPNLLFTLKNPFVISMFPLTLSFL